MPVAGVSDTDVSADSYLWSGLLLHVSVCYSLSVTFSFIVSVL